jgi:ribose 5-phosphate isomerase A
VRALRERVRTGLRIRAVPTSSGIRALAASLGIELIGLDAVSQLDRAIDGADQIDRELRLLKGRGGALLSRSSASFLARNR